MLGGYTGNILKVNLTKGITQREKLDEKMARKFIGGKGLGAKILYDFIKPGIDPFSPENLAYLRIRSINRYVSSLICPICCCNKIAPYRNLFRYTLWRLFRRRNEANRL